MVDTSNLEAIQLFARGKDPSASEGNYFTADLSTWFTIWTYILCEFEDVIDICPHFPHDALKEVPEKEAIYIARHILKQVKNGKAKKFMDLIMEGDDDYEFPQEKLEEFAAFAGFSGGFYLS